MLEVDVKKRDKGKGRRGSARVWGSDYQKFNLKLPHLFFFTIEIDHFIKRIKP